MDEKTAELVALLDELTGGLASGCRLDDFAAKRLRWDGRSDELPNLPAGEGYALSDGFE